MDLSPDCSISGEERRTGVNRLQFKDVSHFIASLAAGNNDNNNAAAAMAMRFHRQDAC